MTQWLDITLPQIAGVLISLLVLYAAVILLTRIFGLRSFSKMSAADFAMTIAVGTVLGGSIANQDPSILVAGLAMIGLFAVQRMIAMGRHRSGAFGDLIDNDPVFLMKDGKLLHDNLKETNVALADIRAKLREANVLRLDSVAAVVFETTGDISVLHSEGSREVDDFIVDGVKGLDSN